METIAAKNILRKKDMSNWLNASVRQNAQSLTGSDEIMVRIIAVGEKVEVVAIVQ